MTTGLRWTAEEVEEFRKRQKRWQEEGKVTVRTHTTEGPNPAKVNLPMSELKPPAGKRRGNFERELKPPSALEALLIEKMRDAQIPEPRREHIAIKGRKFRLDFAWPDRKVGVEVQGMVHRIRERFGNDIEKRALHLIDGWIVLEVGGNEIRDGRAIEWLTHLMIRHPPLGLIEDRKGLNQVNL